MSSFGNAITGNATKAQLTFCPYTNIGSESEPAYEISKSDAEQKQLWNVMINPSSIYESFGISYTSKRGVNKTETETDTSLSPGSHTMSMDLIFDLVDTYELAYNKLSTAGVINFGMSFSSGPSDLKQYRNDHDGKLPKQFAGYNWGTRVSDIDLNNSKLSCLPMLKLAVSNGDPSYLVRFEWGKFKINGFVNDLSIRYTYFSPEGMALRAETSLRILEVGFSQSERLEKQVKTSKTKDNSSTPSTVDPDFADLL